MRRLWPAFALALASCGGAPAAPPAQPPPLIASPPPSPPAAPVPPPSPPAAPALPATLTATPGLDRPASPASFIPAKGTVAASCRAADGELATALHPETVARALAPCKAPAGARVVVRVETTSKGPAARDVVLQEGASAKDAACVRAALLKTGLMFDTGPDDAPRTYECYVAFY